MKNTIKDNIGFVLFALIIVFMLFAYNDAERLLSPDLWDLELEVEDSGAEIQSGDFIWVNDDRVRIVLRNPTWKTFDNVTVWYSVFDMLESEYDRVDVYGVVPTTYLDFHDAQWEYLKNFRVAPYKTYDFYIDFPCYCGGDKTKPIYRIRNGSQVNWYYCKYCSTWELCERKEEFIRCNTSCTLGHGQYLISLSMIDNNGNKMGTKKFYVFAQETSVFADSLWTKPLEDGGLYEK